MAKKIKVRMLTSIAGNAEPLYDLDDFAFLPGQVVEIHAELAKHWLAGGHAVAFLEREPKREPESTAIEPPETTALPDAKPRAGPGKKV